ncbi:hypothetical protein [Winogradskyella sp. PE311]
METSFQVLKSNRLIPRQIVSSGLENIFSVLSYQKIIKYCGVSFDRIGIF